MSQGGDPDIFLTHVYQLRDELMYMGEAVTDKPVTEVVIKGLTNDYTQIKYNAERDPDFSLMKIEIATTRTMLVNRLARGESVRNSMGRESGMFASSPLGVSLRSTKSQNKTFNCGKLGHLVRYCSTTPCVFFCSIVYSLRTCDYRS